MFAGLLGKGTRDLFLTEVARTVVEAVVEREGVVANAGGNLVNDDRAEEVPIWPILLGCRAGYGFHQAVMLSQCPLLCSSTENLTRALAQ